ncbi:hypothetical protein IWW57_000927 [Coemansia sp. S610]|nr:hypothetical protein IWW57_000927 [Coemansia sp. S610]
MSNSDANVYSDRVEGERRPLICQPYCPPPAPLSPEDIRQRRRSLGLASQLTVDARSFDGSRPNSAIGSAPPSPLPRSPAVAQGGAYYSSYGAVFEATGQQPVAARSYRPGGCCAAVCGSSSAAY